VLGRFKAGKSSFLNHFLGRSFLPVGVRAGYVRGHENPLWRSRRARVHHQDGRDPEVPLDGISRYISEKTNPENTREVVLITVELPELRRFRGLHSSIRRVSIARFLTIRKPRYRGCRMRDWR